MTPRTTDTDTVMTAAEVAAEFRVSTRTVARWVKDGLIEAIPYPGRRLRFRRVDVVAIVGGSK